MARIRIPSKALPGFLALSNLDGNQVDSIADYLKDAVVGTGPAKLYEHLSKNLNIPGARDIVNTLVGMSDLLSADDLNIDDLAGELSTSYYDQSEVLTGQDNIDPKRLALEDTLRTIFLNSKNLRLTLKAIGLLAGDNYIFRDSQIVIDIRPVFNQDIEESPRSAVLIHHLHINYTKKGLKKIILALDLADLKKLRTNIDRAITKEELLKKDYDQAFKFLTFHEEL